MPPATGDPGPESERLRALIAGVGRGEQAPFAELYDQTVGAVHQLALLISRGDERHASEVVQATYRRVWDAASAWDDATTRPLSWVLSLTRTAGVLPAPS